nr:ArsR family transcriptional regulator [Natrinema sp. SYSU A 869]
MEAMACARESEHCMQPAEAFSLIGDETRVKILEALWNADETPLRFSALYDRVPIDTSPQFNYHLDRLTGQFVRKTDAGYELRTAGENVVRAIVAGSFTAHPRLEPFETGDECTRCGEVLTASYEDEQLAVTCRSCGRTHGEYAFPPGGLLDRSRNEVLDAFNQRVRHLHCLAKDGVCPECSGRMRTELVREGGCCLDTDLRVEYVCEQCRHSLCSTVGIALLDQSSLVAFYRDHGIDVGTVPYWQLNWCVSDDSTTVRSTDPWRLDMSIPLGDEVLEFTLDGKLSVIESQRRESCPG